MKRPRSPANRYDVSGNSEAQFLDAEQTVLVNTKGITDLDVLQVLEEEGLAGAYELLLSEVRTDTPMTCELLRHIHKLIFGELYEWAGRWRTVRISKPGVSWPPPDFLEQAMEELQRSVLGKYPVASLQDDEVFCEAAGHIQGEFLAIHPFREGNARTIKLLTDLLAVQSGRPLLRYDHSARGRATYIAAAKAALLQNFEAMTRVISDALAKARRGIPDAAGSAAASSP